MDYQQGGGGNRGCYNCKSAPSSPQYSRLVRIEVSLPLNNATNNLLTSGGDASHQVQDGHVLTKFATHKV